MSLLLRCLVLGSLLFLGCLPGALAQPQPSDTTQLPEIAPREIEIRGDLQIDFPALERQPLDGFLSPPSLPTVPAERIPYVEPYALDLDALSGVPPEPAVATQQSTSRPPAPRSGSIEAGAGRYFSRFFNTHLSAPISSNERLAFHVDYTGTEGETPFEGRDVESSNDEAKGGLRFKSRRDPVHLDVALTGAVDDYVLFGVPGPSGVSASAPERTLASGGGSVDLQTVGSVASRLRLSYTRTQSETTGPSGSDFSFRQGRVSGTGELHLPFGPVDGTLDVTFGHTRIRDDVPDRSESELDVGGLFTVLERPSLTVRGGARVLWTRGPTSPGAASSPDVSSTYVSPVVDAKWDATSWATVVAQNRPHLEGSGLLALHRENPYAELAPPTRPTLYTVDAQTGVNLSLGWVRIEPRFGVKYAPSYRFFVAPSFGSNGLFSARYEDARIIHGGGTIALQGLDGIQASIGLSARDGRLTDLDTDIPNFASVTADAMFGVSFADDKGHLQLTGRLEGPRDVDLAGTDEVDTYLSIDVKGSYAVTPLIDLVVRADRIGADTLERWPGFPRPANSIGVGARIRW